MMFDLVYQYLHGCSHIFVDLHVSRLALAVGLVHGAAFALGQFWSSAKVRMPAARRVGMA